MCKQELKTTDDLLTVPPSGSVKKLAGHECVYSTIVNMQQKTQCVTLAVVLATAQESVRVGYSKS